MESTPPSTVLLITDRPGDVAPLRDALADERRGGAPGFVLAGDPLVPELGLGRLADGGVDVVLLDLGGAPELALDTLVRSRIEAPEVPVVLVTAAGDDHTGAQGVDAGAEDYLAADQLGGGILARVLRYAIERQRLHATLQHLSLSDELTGLYNHRGFVALCEHHLRLAPRTRGLLVAVADIEGLGAINERHGRDEGDRAIVAAARVLRSTFRASDVVARLGGDDFAVLMLDAADGAAEIVAPRLRARIAQHNAAGAAHPYRLALRLAVARAEPDSLADAASLIERAAAALVAHRR